MQWMADCGTNAISIGVLEQDLFAAVENYNVICEEAHRVGMKVYATPSRWGQLVAGSPKVPSLFCAMNPDAWAMGQDGKMLAEGFGAFASVHHPKTYEFFCRSLEKMLTLFPIQGIVWDEVKNLQVRDYSHSAQSALAGLDIDDFKNHIDATANFFERISQFAKSIRPELHLCLFMQGMQKGYAIERMAEIESLHDFGCDGRAFRYEDAPESELTDMPVRKTLCDDGPKFMKYAKDHGKNSMLLIENHHMSKQYIELMDKRLPDVLAMNPDHLLYYYYPRSVACPDQNMKVIQKHLCNR